MLQITVFWLLLGHLYAKSVILHGGGTFQTYHFSKVIELAGGPGTARIGIITAAASTPEDNGIWYEDQFMSYGAAEAYWIPVHIGNTGANSDPTVVANVERMTGFMFGAGDQARIIESLYNNGRVESPVLTAIRSVYDSGGVVAGTSAGCAAMGTAPMVMGGMSWDALVYGAYVWGEEIGVDDLIYDPAGGIGMLQSFIPDTHFSERGREGRLVRLVSDTTLLSNGVEKGIGVDEDTALVITDVDTASAQGELLGPYGALIVDLSQSSVTGGEYWGIQSVYAHYLTNGDTINMDTLSVTPGTWKENLQGNEYYDSAIESEKIFNGNRDDPDSDPEFVQVSRSIFDSRLDSSTSGRTEESNPTFQVDFQQEFSSDGYGGYNDLHGGWQITYTNLGINIIYL